MNISPFIKELPGGKSNLRFSTEHASGSTSQASGIMEAIDAGAKLLLIDEDRSATNFMIRDAKMKALIQKEPITPFTDRIRELAAMGVSTILVIGGSGEYLGAADRIYLMDDYVISDATDEGQRIWEESDSEIAPPPPCDWTQTRRLRSEGFSSYPPDSHTERLEVSDMGFVLIGAEKVDVRGLYNLMTDAQRSAAAFILRDLMLSHKPGLVNLDEELGAVYERIEAEGLHTVFSSFFTTMEMPLDLPREIEVRGIVNRMRGILYR